MPTYERLDYGSDDGCQIGGAATDKVGFYGTTPVVQRATATSHTTTNCVTSTAFGTQQQAIVQEIMNTLIACGLWAA